MHRIAEATLEAVLVACVDAGIQEHQVNASGRVVVGRGGAVQVAVVLADDGGFTALGGQFPDGAMGQEAARFAKGDGGEEVGWNGAGVPARFNGVEKLELKPKPLGSFLESRSPLGGCRQTDDVQGHARYSTLLPYFGGKKATVLALRIDLAKSLSCPP